MGSRKHFHNILCLNEEKGMDIIMRVVVYVEESENALARALVKRKDIKLILIRFSNCLFFSEVHKENTKRIPTFIVDKFADFDRECNRLKSFLAENCNKIDVFYNDSEFNQVYIQKMARTINLPGALSEYQATVVRDKYVMKQFIESIGLKCAEYCLVSSSKDLFRCADEWGYPFIVKWRFGVSSMEIYRINEINDIENLFLDFSSGKYMAEKFQPNKIWCIDAIVGNGEILSNLYTWLPFTNLSFAENKTKFVQLAVGFSQKYWKFAPEKMTKLIVNSLGLHTGYLHLEVFVLDNGEPVICEFAWRTPGDHMLENFSVMYGFSIENYLINVLLGETPSKLEPIQSCVSDIFLPMSNGRITRISTIEEIMQKCEIVDGAIMYKKGDILSSKHKYTDASGWVQVVATNVNEMLRKIEEVYSAFLLDVEEIT